MPPPTKFLHARGKGWRFFGGLSEKYYPYLAWRKALLIKKRVFFKKSSLKR